MFERRKRSVQSDVVFERVPQWYVSPSEGGSSDLKSSRLGVESEICIYVNVGEHVVRDLSTDDIPHYNH